MAKKKQRTDAERRARQCERLSRHLRVLRLILGPGRWDSEALARELECSTRTVHRILQTLTMAGVPWFYEEELRAYRVRSGFKFPGLESSKSISEPTPHHLTLLTSAQQLLADGERFIDSLRQYCTLLQDNH